KVRRLHELERGADEVSLAQQEKRGWNVIVQRAALGARGVVAVEAALGLLHRGLGRVGLRDLVEVVHPLLRVLLGRLHRLDSEALATDDHRALLQPVCANGNKGLPPVTNMPCARHVWLCSGSQYGVMLKPSGCDNEGVASLASTGQITSLIKEGAAAAGFDLAGIAPVVDFPELGYFSDWVAAGHAGEMRYLESRDENGQLKRSSLRATFPW